MKSINIPDEELRDELTDNYEDSFIVEAGAGSGKTTLLVKRLLNIIISDAADISEVVAITFTEKAAAEMKTRLREELILVAQRSGPGGVEECADTHKKVQKTLSRLEDARISTIHSFCSRLLAENSPKSGVSPIFSILGDDEERLLFDYGFEEWIAEQEDESAEGLRLSLRLGIDKEILKKTAREILENSDAVEYIKREGELSDEAKKRFEMIKDKVQEIRDHAEKYCRDDTDRGYLDIKEKYSRIKKALSISDEYTEALMLSGNLFFDARAGDRRKWENDEAGKSKSMRGEYKGLISVKRSSVNNGDRADANTVANFKSYTLSEIRAQQILEWIAGFASYIDERKRKMCALSFQDLLIKTRDFLRSDSESRRAVRSSIKHLLIDEFQDTDPLQIEIVELILEKCEEETCTNQTVVFIVGDPKQSIYRFRRADIDTYENFCRLLVEKGICKKVELKSSFRFTEQLVNIFNRVFSEVLKMNSDDSGHYYQPDYIEMESCRGSGEYSKLMPLKIITANPEAKASDLANIEALSIAKTINEILKKDIKTGGKDKAEQLKAKDIAVLMRATTHQEKLERALDIEGIDYLMESGQRLWKLEEVMDVINILEAVERPYDEIAIIAALRGFVFAVSDADIYSFRKGNRSFNYLLMKEDAENEEHPVYKALLKLKKLNAASRVMRMDSYISYMIDYLKVLEIYTGILGTERAKESVMKLVSNACEQATSNIRIIDFIRLLRDREVAEQREATGAAGEIDENRVRLMTLHSAKGLEFPVVILFQVHRIEGGSGKNKRRFIFDKSTQRCAAAFGGEVETRAYGEIDEINKKHEEAETERLRYVGMTRARDYLVVPTMGFEEKKKKSGEIMTPFSMYNLFEKYGIRREELSEEKDSVFREGRNDCCETVELKELTSFNPTIREEDSINFGNAKRARTAIAKELEEAINDGNKSRIVVRPSSLRGLRQEDAYKRDYDEERASEAKRFGNAFHRLFELLPPGKPFSEAYLKRVAEEFDVDEKALRQAYKKTSESPLIERASRASKIWVEVPVMAAFKDDDSQEITDILRSEENGYADSFNGGNFVVEGIVDLVFLDDGMFHVIDYKTDDVEEVELDTRAEFYAPQLRAYAKAISKCGHSIGSAHLLFARLGIAREISLNDA